MGVICTEGDWRYLRRIQPKLLDQLARRINEKTASLLHSSNLPEIEKYRAVYQHLTASDALIARCFDDWRRSTLFERLLAIRRAGLLTEEQLQQLSPQIQELLNDFCR